MNSANFVHKTAEINDDAEIGEGCVIWNDAQIREGAVLGKDCIIGKGVYIDAGVKIGARCKIQNYACVYNGVRLEDDVFIGPCVSFTNDARPRAFNRYWEVIETLVRQGASIGANTTVICGTTIGKYAMVGAGSVVTRDIRAYTLAYGCPAREIKKINKMGMDCKADKEKGEILE